MPRPSLLCYSPECVEGDFLELSPYGVLRSSGIGEVCSICSVGRRSAEETAPPVMLEIPKGK
jgi:hypothetical protein